MKNNRLKSNILKTFVLAIVIAFMFCKKQPTPIVTSPFKQIEVTNSVTVSWDKNTEPDLEGYILYGNDVLINYISKDLNTYVYNYSPSVYDSVTFELFAYDHSHNISLPSRPVGAWFAWYSGIMGDWNSNGKFDSTDYSIADSLIKNKKICNNLTVESNYIVSDFDSVYYSDRYYQILYYPSFLSNLKQIITRNDDKEGGFVSLEVNNPVNIFTCYDSRFRASWLENWKIVGSIGVTDASADSFIIYKKYFNKNNITLGSNENAKAMYFVFIEDKCTDILNYNHLFDFNSDTKLNDLDLKFIKR